MARESGFPIARVQDANHRESNGIDVRPIGCRRIGGPVRLHGFKRCAGEMVAILICSLLFDKASEHD
jgi:hypothetical protein